MVSSQSMKCFDPVENAGRGEGEVGGRHFHFTNNRAGMHVMTELAQAICETGCACEAVNQQS